jgi:hypothetical protein
MRVGLEQLLTDRLRILGPDHPHTLTTQRNLAYWREQASRPRPAPRESERR